MHEAVTMSPRQTQSMLQSEGQAEYVGEGPQMATKTASRIASSGLPRHVSLTPISRNVAANFMCQSVKVVKHKRKLRSKRKKIGTGSLKKHYAPCGCKTECADQCRCVANNMNCEKYCGCSRQCENRYRGCDCLAGQCRGKGCCCFVVERECDPDICRNCNVSCKDGSTCEPPKNKIRSCKNMNILIARGKQIYKDVSGVAGHGAFTSESINKDEYLGEYTGEAILHEEADMRQEDHPDSSYLFELDKKYVIDGRYEGSLLRFVNHSSKPNCYPKNMFSEGAQRIAYFAKRNIKRGEELLISYGRKYAAIWKHIKKKELPKTTPIEAST